MKRSTRIKDYSVNGKAAGGATKNLPKNITYLILNLNLKAQRDDEKVEIFFIES